MMRKRAFASNRPRGFVVLSALAIGTILTATACSTASSSEAAEDGPTDDGRSSEQTFAASPETRDALGVDRWTVAYATDTSLPAIIVSGADEAGAIRTSLAIRSSGSESEARWLELIAPMRKVGMRFPMTGEESVVVLGRDEFVADAIAKRTLERIDMDLRSPAERGMTNSVRPLDGLINKGGPLVQSGMSDCIQHLTICLASCNVTQSQISSFCHDTLLANTPIGAVPVWGR